MLKYFIIFTAIGIVIGKVPSRGVALLCVAFISLLWGINTEVIWGLAAFGELFLGYLIGAAFFKPKEGLHSSSQGSHQRIEPALDQRSLQERQLTNRLEEPSMGLASLILFRARTLEVLKRELSYSVATPGHQQESFNKVTRNAQELGINEYDAAIAFMLLELKTLTRPLSRTVKEFYAEKLSKCMSLVPKSKGSLELMNIFVVDHRNDFSDSLLARPDMAFVTGILDEEDELPPESLKYKSDAGHRLSELKKLKDKGLISQEQYDGKANEIIRDL